MSVRCLARPAIRMIHMHTSTSICLCIYTCTFRSLQLCLLLLLQSCGSRQEGPPSFPPSVLSPSLPLSLLSSSLWCRPSLALAQEPLCQVQAQEGAPPKPLTRGNAAPLRRLALSASACAAAAAAAATQVLLPTSTRCQCLGRVWPLQGWEKVVWTCERRRAEHVGASA